MDSSTTFSGSIQKSKKYNTKECKNTENYVNINALAKNPNVTTLSVYKIWTRFKKARDPVIKKKITLKM